MLGRHTITLDVTIRLCRRTDLADLEWFGLYSRYRQLFLQQYERQEKGENVMLVAEANGFPVGRLWIDLAHRREDSIGVLWSLAVLPPLRNLGIGTRLIIVAEELLISRGFLTAEIGAEKDNPGARRLYERQGYQVIRDNLEEWNVTTPEGRVIHEFSDEWIMQKALGR
jgi:ribosomal protein S18 acetylase RimI-like enzyme